MSCTLENIEEICIVNIETDVYGYGVQVDAKNDETIETMDTTLTFVLPLKVGIGAGIGYLGWQA